MIHLTDNDLAELDRIREALEQMTHAVGAIATALTLEAFGAELRKHEMRRGADELKMCALMAHDKLEMLITSMRGAVASCGVCGQRYSRAEWIARKPTLERYGDTLLERLDCQCGNTITALPPEDDDR